MKINLKPSLVKHYSTNNVSLCMIFKARLSINPVEKTILAAAVDNTNSKFFPFAEKMYSYANDKIVI